MTWSCSEEEEFLTSTRKIERERVQLKAKAEFTPLIQLAVELRLSRHLTWMIEEWNAVTESTAVMERVWNGVEGTVGVEGLEVNHSLIGRKHPATKMPTSPFTTAPEIIN